MIDAGNAKRTAQVCLLAFAEEESWLCDANLSSSPLSPVFSGSDIAGQLRNE